MKFVIMLLVAMSLSSCGYKQLDLATCTKLWANPPKPMERDWLYAYSKHCAEAKPLREGGGTLHHGTVYVNGTRHTYRYRTR